MTSRAEVAAALSVDAGPEVVWLGAAMIIGAGSTSFEMLRYVGDRFVLIPLPAWMDNPMDPISIRDVLYYLAATADAERVPRVPTTSSARQRPRIATCWAHMAARQASGGLVCRSVEWIPAWHRS